MSVKSVRLNPALEARLDEAARISVRSVSKIIREAIEERCRHILGEQLAPRLADVTGIVHSAGGRARRTGKAFATRLKAKRGHR
jgi:predicted transcriptional regulator